MKILVIGGGNMGLTYARGLARKGSIGPDELMILERYPPRVEEILALGIGDVYTDLKDCLPQAELIIIAVKPQDSAALFEVVRPLANARQVYVSIMAGVTIDTIVAGVGVPKVVRAMPNLPAQIGQGMTTYVCSPAVSALEDHAVGDLLGITGKVFRVGDEYGIDATTAISGSGPAYVIYFMRALMEAAEEMNFDEAQAKQLVVQTFMGAAKLLDRHDITPEEWIRRVSSKGGTTEAAIKSFLSTSIHADIKEGAHAALNRAIELGQGG